MMRSVCAQRLSFSVVSVLALGYAAHAQAQANTETPGNPQTSGNPQTPGIAQVPARGHTLTYGVDVGVAESDNVTLVPTDKVSQTMAVTDLDFAAKEQSRLLDLNATGNFSYLDYLQNAYGSQLTGRFDGMAHVAIIPERLTWVLQDDFGQAALDPFTPTTPTNLEDINYFSTGPDLALRVGSTSFVNMSARYSRTTYETSPFNSNRLYGSLAWGLNLSARSSVSLNGDIERVLFENTVLNSDFDRTNGFVQYSLQGARTELKADLGATDISQGNTSTTGGLGTIELTRKISAASSLIASLGHDLTDAAASFSGLQGGATGVVGTAPAAQTSSSYTSNYGSVGWQFVRNRTTIAVSGRWEKDTYDAQPALDYSRGGVEINLQRRLTHAFTAQLVGRYYKTDYTHAIVAPTNGSSDYEDGFVAGILTWRHGRGLEVRFRAEHTTRVAPGTDFGYGENRVLLTIGYRPNAVQAGPLDNNPGT
jgi:hypothetical protein